MHCLDGRMLRFSEVRKKPVRTRYAVNLWFCAMRFPVGFHGMQESATEVSAVVSAETVVAGGMVARHGYTRLA